MCLCVLGYGDIYCKTILGKVSCLLFIIGGLVSLDGTLHGLASHLSSLHVPFFLFWRLANFFKRAISFVAGKFWEPLHLFKPCSNVLLELRLLSHGHHVDRWQNVSNNSSWHCLISLVGYGDIVCKTKMGRVLQLLSLLVGLVRYLYLEIITLDFLIAGGGSCSLTGSLCICPS